MEHQGLGRRSDIKADNLDVEEDRARHWQRIGAAHQLSVASNDGSVSLMLTDFPAYEGSFSYSDRLNIYMGVQRPGRIFRRSDAQLFDAVLHPGRVGFAVPGTAGEGFWEDVRVLLLSAELAKLPIGEDGPARGDDFVPVASRPHDDPLLTAVLTAMWRDAEAHGLVSAFFDHGLLIVSNRLLTLPTPKIREARPLDRLALAKALEWIENSVGGDMTVGELAVIVGMSQHHFSRAFKASMGVAPYEYLTIRRIERAKDLLMVQSLSVLNVALEVGYSNPSQFAAAFRRITGASPSKWRLRFH